MARQKDIEGGRLWSSLLTSVLFFIVYFAIHWFINIFTGEGEHVVTFNHREMLGPYTISLCSSLLIFSLGSFISRGMKHLSIVVPGVFFNAFMIFVFSQIVVQIAGHCAIFSATTNKSGLTQSALETIEVLSLLSVPITFASLFWLEMYQTRVYNVVHDRLPEAATQRHGNPLIALGCTVASIIISVIEYITHEYRWVFFAEFILALIVVVSTFVSAKQDAQK
jgi:hypothetical protein